MTEADRRAPMGWLPAPLRAATQRARGAAKRGVALLQKYGPDGADLFFVGFLVSALLVSITGNTFIFHGQVLTATIVGLSLCFLITSRSLKVLGSPGLERTFLALAALVCAAWLYEFPFHYAWPTALSRLGNDLSNFGRNTTGGNQPWPFWWGLIMVMMPFSGMRYMRLNRWLLIFSALGAITFFLWWAIGFPDLFHPQWFPNQSPWIHLVPDQYRHPTTDSARSIVGFYGGVFNSLTKVIVCIIPATLFLPSAERRKAAPPMLESKIWARTVGRFRRAPAGDGPAEPPAPGKDAD